MKSRVFFVLSLAAFLVPGAVLSKENRDNAELSTKVKCRESALKDFDSESLPEGVTAKQVFEGIRKTKTSGDAA